MNAPSRLLPLAGFIALSFLAAVLGGWATARSVGAWYPTLVKPAWNPPAWLFGPVWSVLYLMMGIAAWRVWEKAGWGGALALFCAQLALNALWSVCFFGLRNPLAGLVEIAFLWLTVAATLAVFMRVDRLAGALFIPYLLWVSFATLLNFTLWRLNR